MHVHQILYCITRVQNWDIGPPDRGSGRNNFPPGNLPDPIFVIENFGYKVRSVWRAKWQRKGGHKNILSFQSISSELRKDSASTT